MASPRLRKGPLKLRCISRCQVLRFWNHKPSPALSPESPAEALGPYPAGGAQRVAAGHDIALRWHSPFGCGRCPAPLERCGCGVCIPFRGHTNMWSTGCVSLPEVCDSGLQAAAGCTTGPCLGHVWGPWRELTVRRRRRNRGRERERERGGERAREHGWGIAFRAKEAEQELSVFPVHHHCQAWVVAGCQHLPASFSLGGSCS